MSFRAEECDFSCRCGQTSPIPANVATCNVAGPFRDSRCKLLMISNHKVQKRSDKLEYLRGSKSYDTSSASPNNVQQAIVRYSTISHRKQ